MKAIEDMNKEELTNAVLFEDDMTLYQSFDEQRFLAGDYTEEELRSIVKSWIMECPDTMKYQVQFQTVNGFWYDHESYKELAAAIAEIEFHIAVSGKAAYGFRVLDVDTQNFVLENYL